MKYSSFPIILATLASASAVSADGFEYMSYGLSYSNLSIDSGSLDVLSGSAAIDYRTGNYVLNGGLNMINLDGGGDSVTLTDIDVTAGYYFTDFFVAYGALNYVDFDDDHEQIYTLGGEYMFGDFTVGLNYSASNENVSVVYFGGDNLEDGVFNLYGSYRMSEVLEASIVLADLGQDTVAAVGLDYDNGAFDAAAMFLDFEGETLFAASGNYDFGNGFRALGSYSNFADEMEIINVGAGYEVTDNVWLDASFGQLSESGSSYTAETFSIGFSYEFGGQSLLVDRIETLQSESLGIFAANGT